MSFLNGGKQRTKRGKPTESARVGESIIVDLWIDEGDTYAWSLSRANPKDETKSFRTLRPADALEAVEGVAFLMHVLSRAPGFSSGDAVSMKKFGQSLDRLVSDFKSDKPSEANVATNGETKSVLVSPNR